MPWREQSFGAGACRGWSWTIERARLAFSFCGLSRWLCTDQRLRIRGCANSPNFSASVLREEAIVEVGPWPVR
jgi:hypothetical protein